MDTVSTYSEARNEYMKQLATWVTPYMISHFRNVWSEAVAAGGPRRSMIVFQEKCAEVPKWNQDTIDANVNKLLDNCRCDYLEELMAAVFIAHTKVLIAIRVSSKHKKLQITLPKLDHFLHRIFSECARSFWKAPFLFLDDQKPIEMQKNVLQAEALCTDAIGSAVRSLLPIKNILNEYLSDDVLNAEPIIEKEDEKVSGGAFEALAPMPVAPAPEKVTEVEEEFVSPAMRALGAEANAPAPAPLPAPAPVAAPAPAPVAAPVPAPVAAPVPAPTAAPPKPKPVSPVSKSTKVTVEKTAAPEPEELVVETEPAVHFSNYDNVFDENTEQVASYRYVPKDDSEPVLEIKEDTAQPLSMDADVTQLDGPAPAPAAAGLLVDEILD